MVKVKDSKAILGKGGKSVNNENPPVWIPGEIRLTMASGAVKHDSVRPIRSVCG